MKEIQSNINIVGGGLIGAVAAYSLSKLGNKVVVLEQNAKFNNKNILDKRTTAISEGTKKFLEEINIWNEIGNYAEPIKNIEIIDINQSNKIYFENLILWLFFLLQDQHKNKLCFYLFLLCLDFLKHLRL